MSYVRRAGESVEKYRRRVERAWKSRVGPVLAATPLAGLKAMARSLEALDEVLEEVAGRQAAERRAEAKRLRQASRVSAKKERQRRRAEEEDLRRAREAEAERNRQLSEAKAESRRRRHQAELERLRLLEVEAERRRQLEAERLRQAEVERLRQVETASSRQTEAERLRRLRERLRQAKVDERFRQVEDEKRRRLEKERVLAEKEKLRQIEQERRQANAERRRRAEEERLRRAEEERQRRAEVEMLRRVEEDKRRQLKEEELRRHLAAEEETQRQLRAEAAEESIEYLLDWVEWASIQELVGGYAPSAVERGVVGFASVYSGNRQVRPEAAAIAAALDPRKEYEYCRKLYQGDPGRAKWDNQDWEPSRIKGGGRSGPEISVLTGAEIRKGLIGYIIDSTWQSLSQSNLLGFVGIFRELDVPTDWLPMRHGELNCFVAAVLPSFKGKKVSRGQKSPIELLKSFAATYKAAGVVPENVWPLESALRVKFTFWDIDGNQLADSGVLPKGKYKQFHLVRHNAHCFLRDALPQFPKERTPGLLPWVGKVPLCAPAPVTDKEREAQREAQREAELQRLLQYAGTLPAGLRAWIVGRELVTSDGSILRSKDLEGALRLAASIEQVPEEEALVSVGGVQSFRFKCWLKKNSIGKASPKVEKLWSASTVEARLWCQREAYDVESVFEIDLRACFLACEDPALGRVAGDAAPYVSTYKMPAGTKTRWGSARTLDSVRGLAGSLVRFQSWRLEGHDYLGLFDAHLRENDGLMPTPLAIALLDLGYLVEHELAEVGYEVAPNPPLQFLNMRDPDNGAANKDLSINFVGSCVKRPTLSYVLNDEQEAIHIYNLLLRKGCRPKKTGSGPYLIKYTDAGDHRDYPHVRAYVLAYAHINLLSMLKRHPNTVRIAVDSLTLPKRDRPIVPTYCPPCYPDGSKAAAQAERSAHDYPPGVWREKGAAKPWSSCYFSLPSDAASARAEPAAERSPLPPRALLHPLVYNNGQGGSGKTTSRIHDLSGRRVALLGKDWWNVLDLMKKTEKAKAEGYDTSRYSCHTWHGFWHAGLALEECEKTRTGPASKGCGKCLYCTGWKPERMVSSANRHLRDVLPEFIIWDEIGFVPEMYARPILAFCREKRITVIACADLEGQQRQFNDRDLRNPPKVLRLLREFGAAVVTEAEDRRSLCDRLRALKADIWCEPEGHQIIQSRAALREIDSVGALANALRRWAPTDIFAVTTNSIGKSLEKQLLREHGSRYRDHKVPMRFKPHASDRVDYTKHQEVSYPGYLVGEPQETTEAYVGTRVWVEYDQAIWYMENERKPLWVYDGWRTIHSLQCLTIGDAEADEWPTLFIMSQGLGGDWNVNATYTAVSRVRKLSQLYWVGAPQTTTIHPPPPSASMTRGQYDLDDIYG